MLMASARRLGGRRRQLPHREVKSNVVRHVQVWKQRVVLKHHGNAA